MKELPSWTRKNLFSSFFLEEAFQQREGKEKLVHLEQCHTKAVEMRI